MLASNFGIQFYKWNRLKIAMLREYYISPDFFPMHFAEIPTEVKVQMYVVGVFGIDESEMVSIIERNMYNDKHNNYTNNTLIVNVSIKVLLTVDRQNMAT